MHCNETRKKFYEMALDGVPYKQVQATLHLGHATAMRWCSEMGLKPRKRGRKPKLCGANESPEYLYVLPQVSATARNKLGGMGLSPHAHPE
jgi:transposase